MIAASARSAQLAEDVADQLFTLDIPSSVRTGEHAEDRVDAYCDAMTAAAQPALRAATEKYVACFERATELGWLSEWSTLCETALERLEPQEYPPLSELHHNLDEPLSWNDAGLVLLKFRNYKLAKQLFATAVGLAPTSYDALIGLGIARRGLGELDGAEASYERARDLDPTRGDAYYDLGILYKDFRASTQGDQDPVTALHRSLDAYKRARELFAQFRTKTDRPDEQIDARNAIADCDKAMNQIETYLVAE